MNIKAHNALFMTLALSAKSRIQELDITEVHNNIHENKNIILIDVRESNEWQTGHLPQAIHLSKGILERDIEKLIPDTNTLIILYCSGGYRSALAADNLQKMGYKNIYSMKGGTTAWTQAGLELIVTHEYS